MMYRRRSMDYETKKMSKAFSDESDEEIKEFTNYGNMPDKSRSQFKML